MVQTDVHTAGPVSPKTEDGHTEKIKGVEKMLGNIMEHPTSAPAEDHQRSHHGMEFRYPNYATAGERGR
jgi:hypothetical protein